MKFSIQNLQFKGFTTKGSLLSYRRNTKLKLEEEVKAKRLNTIYNMLDEYEKYDINGVNESDTKVISKREDENDRPRYIECKHMLSGKFLFLFFNQPVKINICSGNHSEKSFITQKIVINAIKKSEYFYFFKVMYIVLNIFRKR